MINKIQDGIGLNRYTKSSSFLNHYYIFMHKINQKKQETIFFSSQYNKQEKGIEYFYKSFYKIEKKGYKLTNKHIFYNSYKFYKLKDGE